MSKKYQRRRRRHRLWAADPKCYWCSRVTRIVEPNGGRLPKDAATIDHLYSKLDPRRGKVDGETTVLACWGCNCARSTAEHVTLWQEEVKRRLAERKARLVGVVELADTQDLPKQLTG